MYIMHASGWPPTRAGMCKVDVNYALFFIAYTQGTHAQITGWRYVNRVVALKVTEPVNKIKNANGGLRQSHPYRILSWANARS